MGKLQDEWAGGPFGGRQRPCVVCSLPPTSKDSFPTQRRLCEAGPPAGGGGAGGRATGSRAALGGKQVSPAGSSGTPSSQHQPGLPPMSVQQRRGAFGGRVGSPSLISRTQVSGEGELCTWALQGSEWPEAGRGPEPTLSCSHLDLIVLLSVGELEGVGLHRAGHRGPAAGLGCPPLFIQALPRGPPLGQHLHQLLPGIHLSVVAAAPAATPAASPVPARAHVSRCPGTASHGAGPRLSRWAKPSSYPIGAASTGWGACGRGWGA